MVVAEFGPRPATPPGSGPPAPVLIVTSVEVLRPDSGRRHGHRVRPRLGDTGPVGPAPPGPPITPGPSHLEWRASISAGVPASTLTGHPPPLLGHSWPGRGHPAGFENNGPPLKGVRRARSQYRRAVARTSRPCPAAAETLRACRRICSRACWVQHFHRQGSQPAPAGAIGR